MKDKKKRKLPREIFSLFLISALFSVAAYFFVRSMAGSLVYDYCEKNRIVLDALQEIQTDYLIDGGSLILAVLIFISLFLLLVGRKLSYLQVILEGIEALRIHRMDHVIPVKGDNEFTELAKSINYLSKTERELSEKEAQLKKERELLIRALSHDIRTPLTSLKAYSELMAEKTREGEISGEEIQSYLALMIRKSDQMKELTDQLLDNNKHNPEPVEDGRLLMEQLVFEWEEMLEDRFDVRVSVEHCPSFSYRIDIREFQRIFDNLYSNVVKYADENAPVELFVGQEDGRLLITQKNRKKKEISHVESHQIGILSIKSIAGNYGGDVKVANEETAFEIEIRLIEVS